MLFFNRRKKAGVPGSSGNGALAFFDVETPNKLNDRICSIAVVKTDYSGNLIEHASFYVDPESGFDFVNTSIHGISGSHVKGAMNFNQLWESKLCGMLENTHLVAHNASFDMSVMNKTMNAYGIDYTLPKCADTLKLSKIAVPELGSYKLPVVCSYLGIPDFSHHDAEQDAFACMNLFWKLCSMVDDVIPLFVPYGYDRYATSHRRHAERRFCDKTQCTADLIKLIENVIGDGVIDIEEAIDVLTFIESNESIREEPSVVKLANLLQDVLMDGDIDDDEQSKLNQLFNHIVNPCSDSLLSDDDVVFEGKKFVLSGDFEHGSKADVAAFIESLGGIFCKSGPSRATDYVVVGSKGSDFWALGNYGTKVKKALDIQAKGFPIKVISEEQLYKGR